MGKVGKSVLLQRIFKRGYRRDGRLAQVDYFQKFLPYIIKRRSEAIILMDLELDMTKSVSYMNKKNSSAGGEIITPFVLFLSAMLRVAVEKPKLNRFVAGKRIYDRNHYEICYVVKTQMNEDGKEVAVKEIFEPTDTIMDIAKRVADTKERVRSSDAGGVDARMESLVKLPRFVLSFIFSMLSVLDWFDLVPASILADDALYSSAFITNVGSIGCHAPYHHLFDRGTTSIFIAMGLLRKENFLQDDGSVGKKDIMDVRFSIDERIADGYYFAKAMELLKYYIENPELLELGGSNS